MLAGCNAVCATGVGDMQACIGALDTFNNGGNGEGVCSNGGEALRRLQSVRTGIADFCLPDDILSRP